MKKSLLLFTVLLPVFLFALPVYAADIRLSSSCTLADAIIAANHDRAEGDCPAGRGADTIILSQDITLDGSLPKITSDITIEGNGYTISGDNRYRIFYNDGGALTIKNLTMTKGDVEGDIIRNADDTLKATADQPFGGAILNWQGTLSIVNSRFSDNLAEYDGGAIYSRDGTLSISDSAFSDNLADDNGGAIYNSNGTLSIVNSAFSRNLADENGGAIYNRGGELSISDNSAFNQNSAKYGGAVHNSGYGELSISDSIFRNNSADVYGGAIRNHGELSISDSVFRNNSAGLWGGAIRNHGELSISDSVFSGNSALYGGAIYNGGDGKLSIVSSTFSHNSANGGGAIVNTGELSIVNSAFSHNSADDDEDGGAIYNVNDGDLRISNSTFSDNSARGGGAIYNGEDGKLRITNSIIAGGRGWRACYSSSRIRRNIGNFIQDGSCSSDFSGDPMLGELIEPEDGSPAYFPLLAGSPAIDAADDGYCPETDQIGTVRPQGTGCDIGAIEYVAP